MKTVTTIKLDEEVKEKAAGLASALGLSLSSVINASLKQFILERRVIFSIEPELNLKSKKVLQEALQEVKSKKNRIGPFTTINDLKKSLSR